LRRMIFPYPLNEERCGQEGGDVSSRLSRQKTVVAIHKLNLFGQFIGYQSDIESSSRFN
jgi:hypothetical protein